MRALLLLVPAAIIAAASPASAKVYLSVAQAQQILFPGAKFTKQFVTLNPSQVSTVLASSNAPLHDKVIEIWRVKTSDGGRAWFVIDQVEGKGDIISYAIAMSDAGEVRGIEIMECVADYDTVRMPAWRAQFIGRKPGDRVDDIETISGSTLSSRHIAEGVRRILATYPMFKSSPK
jgi:hypothetical protein